MESFGGRRPLLFVSPLEWQDLSLRRGTPSLKVLVRLFKTWLTGSQRWSGTGGSMKQLFALSASWAPN